MLARRLQLNIFESEVDMDRQTIELMIDIAKELMESPDLTEAEARQLMNDHYFLLEMLESEV